MNVKLEIQKIKCQHCVDKISKAIKKSLKLKNFTLTVEPPILQCVVKDQEQLDSLKLLIIDLGYQVGGVEIDN